MSERAGWGRLWGQKVCADKGSDLVLVNPGGGALAAFFSTAVTSLQACVIFSDAHLFTGVGGLF